MFKNKVFIFNWLFVFLFSLIANSQQIFYSNPTFDFDFVDNTKFYIVGQLKENIIVAKTNKRGFFINTYNQTMGLKNSVQFKEFNENVEVLDIFNCIDNAILFFTLKLENIKILYCIGLNSDGSIITEPILIDTLHTRFSKQEEKIHLAMSENKKNINCVIQTTQDEGVSFKSFLLNNDMKIIYFIQFLIKSKDPEDLEIISPVINNRGQNFMIITDEKKKCKLLSWQKDNRNVFIQELENKKKNLEKINLKIDNFKNEILIFGLKENSKGQLNVLSFQIFNPITYNITQAVLIPLNKKTTKNIEDLTLTNIDITNVFFSKDSSIFIVGEQNFTKSFQEMNVPSLSLGVGNATFGVNSLASIPLIRKEVIEYESNDILFFKIKNNNLIFTNTIIKKQHEKNTNRFVSHFVFNNGSQLHFYFNNFMLNGSIILNDIFLMPNGELQKLILTPKLKKNCSLMIRHAKQINPNTIIAPYVINGILCFAKISLPIY